MGQEKIEQLLDHLNEAKILTDELIEELPKDQPIVCSLHAILIYTNSHINFSLIRLNKWNNDNHENKS